ncbi:hypothetical protein Agub_g14969, partial [Astrephomene gubernaculifera]
EGSRAEQLGVRRGQKLVALSDPLRYGTLWALQDRPSLRFVVDTFRMRRGAPLDLQLEPLMGAADMDAFFGPEDASPSSSGSSSSDEGGSSQQSATASASASATSTSIAAAAAAAMTTRSLGSGGSGGSVDADASPDDALASSSSIDLLLADAGDKG